MAATDVRTAPAKAAAPEPARAHNVEGIQYLRGIAALMVVAHHARHYFVQGDQWSTFGSRGVDIFFVISGFIMAHSTRAYRADAARAPQALEFVLKRIIRVVPLYWLALLWTSKRDLAAGSGLPDLLRDFFFIPHFHAVYKDAVFPILVPGWTINYEMFFYAVFALSLLQGTWRFAFVAFVLLVLVGLGALPWTSAPALFYTSSVVLEFLLGIVVYLVTRSSRATVAKPMLAAIGLAAAVLLAVENSDPVRGFADGPFAALIVWVAVQWPWQRPMAWLRKLGDASYSIYLFHLASFGIAGLVLHRAGIERVTPFGVAAVLSLHLGVAIGAGLLIHRFIERPSLAWLGERLARSRFAVARRPLPE